MNTGAKTPRRPGLWSAKFGPAQCRAARALLDWPIGELAERTGLSIGRLAEFEARRVRLTPDEARALRRAFQGGDVVAIAERTAGAGARFIARRCQTTPHAPRYVTKYALTPRTLRAAVALLGRPLAGVAHTAVDLWNLKSTDREALAAGYAGLAPTAPAIEAWSRGVGELSEPAVRAIVDALCLGGVVLVGARPESAGVRFSSPREGGAAEMAEIAAGLPSFAPLLD